MNYLILFIVTLLLFVSSCGSVRKEVKKSIEDSIETSIKEIPVKELIIINKTNYLLSPLVLALFTGVILVAVGVRVIGIGVIISSLICITLLISLALYSKIIGAIGLVVLVCAIIILFKKLYDKNIFGKEMITSINTSKKIMTDEQRAKLKIELNKDQSKGTKKIVKNLKGKSNE